MIQVTLVESKEVFKRLENLASRFERSDECKAVYKKLDGFYSAIREKLVEKETGLVSDIDDCFIEILTMYEEYFYTQGYRDGLKLRGILKESNPA